MGQSRSSRFTLVELMIVVAIVMILASVALPAFHVTQLRSKRAEGDANVDGIITAVVAYEAAFDRYPSNTVNGPATIGKKAQTWPTGTAQGIYMKKVGWTPDGDVRGFYGMEIYEDTHADCATSYPTGTVCDQTVTPSTACASVIMDLDANGARTCGWAKLGSAMTWTGGATVY
jgi:Tfp pilus assembly protein PilE